MSMIKGKTVLITGATGLLGSHLAKECLSRGAKVIAVGRNLEKMKGCFADYYGSEYLAFKVADTLDHFLYFSEPIDYIFHAASPVERKAIEEYPIQAIDTNVFATKNLLEYLREQKRVCGVNGRMIIFSSATIYGSPKSRDQRVSEEDTAYTEALDYYNAPYSQSKRMAEVLASSYWKQYGVETVIGRFSYVYGFNVYHAMTAFFEFMQRAVNGEPITINSTRLSRRDNIYVSDAVNGALTIALNGRPGEVYNISSNAQGDNFASIDEIALIMVEQAGRGGEVISKDSIEHLPGLILYNGKLKTLGWDVATDLRSGISAVLSNAKSIMHDGRKV